MLMLFCRTPSGTIYHWTSVLWSCLDQRTSRAKVDSGSWICRDWRKADPRGDEPTRRNAAGQVGSPPPVEVATNSRVPRTIATRKVELSFTRRLQAAFHPRYPILCWKSPIRVTWASPRRISLGFSLPLLASRKIKWLLTCWRHSSNSCRPMIKYVITWVYEEKLIDFVNLI